MAIERIQNRRGTAAQWTETDPILGAAEIGVEVGTPNKFKLGDGSSTWSELDYFIPSGGASYIEDTQKGVANGVATLDANGVIPVSQLASIINSAPATLDTLKEIADSLNNDEDFAGTITAQLAGKASSVHTHTMSAITDLPTDISTYANSLAALDLRLDSAESDIANVQTELNALDYAPSTHTHTSSQITDLEQTILNVASQTAVTVSTFASAYSTTSSDKGKLLVSTSSNAVTLTIDNNLSQGESLSVFQSGAGILSLAAGSGVTLQGAGVSGTSFAINDRYSGATVFCISSGTYAVMGNISGV